MEQHTVNGDPLAILFAIVIMIGGMSLILGGPDLAGRVYKWLWNRLTVRPLRTIARLLGRVSRRGARQLARATRRGVHRVWVRLTT